MASELKHTVAPSGGDFTSLDACLDHLVTSHANFVTADVYGLVEIFGDWSSGADTTAVTVNGLTLDTTRYLKIYTNTANRAEAASWDTGKYQLSVSNDNAMYIRDDYVWEDGLQIESYDLASGLTSILIDSVTASANSITISNSSIRADANSGVTAYVMATNDVDLVLTVWNTYIYARSDNQGTIDGFFPAAIASGNLYNCLAYGLRRGFRGTAAVKVYDSVSFNNNDDFYGTFGTIDYCASDDNDGTNGVAESGGGAAWPSDFTAAGSGDFTLLATSALVGAGGMAGSGTFSDDIEGTIRGAAWDLGPYEYVSSGYSLTCDGGSYGVTGAEAGTLKGSKVAADAGVYILAGQDAGAYYGRAIDADGGVYALTGQDIGALLGRLLAAEAGVYALSGQDIAALFGRKLAADAGVYTVTGSDVTLIYTPGGGAYVLTCEGGAYAITGADAGLLRDAKIAADGGAYIVTGQDAATLIGRLLDAGAGAYALTVQDAALLRAARLAIEAGAYAVTGADATLSLSTQLAEAILKLLRPAQRIVLSPAVPRIVDAVPAQRIVLTDRSEE